MEAIKNMPAAIAANFGELHFNDTKEWKGLGGAGYVYDFAFAPTSGHFLT